MNLKKLAFWALLSCMTLLCILIPTACGDSPATTVPNTPTADRTNTPMVVVVVVTATPEAPTNTVIATPEPPSPTILAVEPTATEFGLPDPTQTEPVPTDEAPPASTFTYHTIVAEYQSLPFNQRNPYLESLKGQSASNWYGWVDVVRKQITTGEWELKLDMDSADPNDSSWDVRTIIAEAKASQFSRGQGVYLSGTITAVSCGSKDCDIDLRDVIFSASPGDSLQPSPQTPSTPAPLPTETSGPSVPTEPPAPPPPTNTPLSPEASIEAGIRKYASNVELQKVEYAGSSVNIVFKVTDRPFLLIEGTQLDVTNILHGAAEGAPANYTQVWIVGMFPLKDAYGNVTDGHVLNLRYDRPTIERINWEGFSSKNIYEIADKAIVHPQLQP